MPYNYLDIVNEVGRRLNEAELTSTNFSTAKGFHATIKDAVNSSIHDINQYYLYWPYNHNSDEITLVAGRHATHLQTRLSTWILTRFESSVTLA